MNIVASAPNLSETVKSKPQQFLSRSNKQTVIILHTKDILFFSRSVHFHRSKYFLVYQLPYISFYSLLFPHYFMGLSRFEVHWNLLTPKPGSFSECWMYCIKGILLFIHSQCIQLCSVCIIFTILCVLWNGSVCSLLWWGSERVCFAVSGGGPNEPWQGQVMAVSRLSLQPVIFTWWYGTDW